LATLDNFLRCSSVKYTSVLILRIAPAPFGMVNPYTPME
jgi:hypothetical protein